MRDAQEYEETNGTNAVGSANKLPPCLSLIGPERKADRANGAEEVDWYCKELSVCCRVSEVANDRWSGVREGVDWNGIAPPDDDGEPDLPFRESSTQRAPLEAILGGHLAGFGACILL